MQTFIKKYKIKKEFLDEIYKWSSTLNAREDEVLKTLKREAVIFEAAFLDRQGEDVYLVYFMKCKNIDKALEILNSSRDPIDLYHKKVLSESLCQSESLEVLIDFECL